jgi:hypothetical protein
VLEVPARPARSDEVIGADRAVEVGTRASSSRMRLEGRALGRRVLCRRAISANLRVALLGWPETDVPLFVPPQWVFSGKHRAVKGES